MASFGPILGPQAIDRSKVILLTVATFATLLGIVLLCAGIYLAISNRGAQIIAKLLGNTVNTTSVGFAMAFLGVVLVTVVFSKLLGTLARLGEAKD